MSATSLQSSPATLVAACKRQLRASAQWESICQRSEDYISAQLAQRGPEGAYSDVSEPDRIALIEQAKRELARDGQLAELKMAVRQMLTRALSHPSEPPHDGGVSANRSLHGRHTDGPAAHPGGSIPDAALRSRQELAAGVCRYLMLKWPHLTKQFSRYVLCPFPATLRPVLWEQCLRQCSLGQRLAEDFPRVPSGPSQLAGRCQAALSSSPLLTALQQWPHTLRLMTEAVESLAQQDCGSDGEECVLVLPFVYAHMGTVLPGATWEAARSTVAAVVWQYTVFMWNRPWHLCSMSLPVAHDAAAMFCGKVNRLLVSVDPELHSSLCSSLAPPPREEGLSSSTQDQFVQALRDVLHPLMARLLVGTVPMSVVCVLLDQHLLSQILPGYDPLPFCVAGLLLLTRRELLRCRNMAQVQSALNQQGPRITPQALLGKVKQCFAGEVSQQVKACDTKFTLREDNQETAALCVYQVHGVYNRQQVQSLEALLSASSPSQSSLDEAVQPSTLAGQRSESQHTQTGSNQRSHTLTGSNQRSTAGSAQRSAAGSNQGSTAGSNQRSTAGSNQRSVARNTHRLAAGSNQGSVTGSNLALTMQVDRPQGGREVQLASPVQPQVDSRHLLSPLSNASSPHRMPLTTNAGQSSEMVAVTSRPTPVHVTNPVSVNVVAGPSPHPRPSANTVAQSGHAVLPTAPPLEGLSPSSVLPQTLSPTAWSPTSGAQMDPSHNLFQTPPPSYPSTAAERVGTPDPTARSRAQEFWLHVFSRFSDGLYLLFHGTEEEAHELERQLAADQDSVESL